MWDRTGSCGGAGGARSDRAKWGMRCGGPQGITGVVGHGGRRGGDGGTVVGQVLPQPGWPNVVGDRGRGARGSMAVPQGRVRGRGEEGERFF